MLLQLLLLLPPPPPNTGKKVALSCTRKCSNCAGTLWSTGGDFKRRTSLASCWYVAAMWRRCCARMRRTLVALAVLLRLELLGLLARLLSSLSPRGDTPWWLREDAPRALLRRGPSPRRQASCMLVVVDIPTARRRQNHRAS